MAFFKELTLTLILNPSENLRTEIGKTGVIQACAVLLQTSEGEKEGVAQLLRIVGNLCFDHGSHASLFDTSLTKQH